MKTTTFSLPDLIQEFLDTSRLPDEATVRRLVQEEPELATLLILEQARRLRESQNPKPSTPSGMIPPYEKPAAPKRKKKSGRPQGHPGSRRPVPPKIDQRVEHRLERCPDCGGELRPCTSENSTRTRIVEDIPADIQPVVTEHILHRDYCPHCKKLVEPTVPDALPGATVGNHLLVLSAHWHYGLGMPVSQIVTVLNSHLHFPVSEGGLIQMWQRLADRFEPWYEQLIDQAYASAVLHADETSWRVKGKTHWLWCFTNERTTVYMLDQSRGSPALWQFFKDAYEGVLVTDFWAAYDSIAVGPRQFCLAHLLRELEKVDASNRSAEWSAFSKKTKRLFHDALRLRHREDFSPETYPSRIDRMDGRLVDLMLTESHDADVQRLAKRLRKYWDELLTFLKRVDVPVTNNHAEREIRPAVIMRKVIQGNRSDKGARTQAVLMSIFRTLKRREKNPVETLIAALQDSIRTGCLTPLSSDG